VAQHHHRRELTVRPGPKLVPLARPIRHRKARDSTKVLPTSPRAGKKNLGTKSSQGLDTRVSSATRPVMVPCIRAIFRDMLPFGATKFAVSRAGSKMADCSIWSFSVPLAAAIIAGFGVWFAGRQAVMAEERMEFDKFERRWDKRWTLYEATRDILAKGFDEIKSDKDIKNYELRSLEAKFLLDEEMYRYLRRVSR
jgi:hypothetical protein